MQEILVRQGVEPRARQRVRRIVVERADGFVDTYGQRYGEGLLLLLRAQLLAARGEPAPVVRAATRRARRLSTERGAHLFAHRATRFLAML